MRKLLHEDEHYLNADISDRITMHQREHPQCGMCGVEFDELDEWYDSVDGVCDDCLA